MEGKKIKAIDWDDVTLEVLGKTLKEKNLDLDVHLPKAILFRMFFQKLCADEIVKFFKDIKECLARKVNEALATDGSMVIIDSMLDKQEAIDELSSSFQSNPVVFNILIYCSLPSLLNHVITRNCLNISTEKRDILYVFEHDFMNMYRPANKVSDRVFYSVESDEFNDFLSRAKITGEKCGLDTEEIKQKFDSACKRFVQSIGLIGSNKVDIVPNFSYDFVVDNSKQICEESAMKVIDFVSSVLTSNNFNCFNHYENKIS